MCFSIDFEGLQVQCSCYARRHNVWRGPGTALNDSSALRRPSEAGFTEQLGCPSTHLGFWRVMHHGGLRMSDFYIISRMNLV